MIVVAYLIYQVRQLLIGSNLNLYVSNACRFIISPYLVFTAVVTSYERDKCYEQRYCWLTGYGWSLLRYATTGDAADCDT